MTSAEICGGILPKDRGWDGEIESNQGDLLERWMKIICKIRFRLYEKGDMVVVVDGEPDVGSADFLLEPTARLDTFTSDISRVGFNA